MNLHHAEMIYGEHFMVFVYDLLIMLTMDTTYYVYWLLGRMTIWRSYDQTAGFATIYIYGLVLRLLIGRRRICGTRGCAIINNWRGSIARSIISNHK